jgi:hypothetical protein
MIVIYIAPAPKIALPPEIAAGHGSVPAAVSTSFPRGLMIAHIATKRAARFPLECGGGAGHEDEREGYDRPVHPILLCLARSVPLARHLLILARSEEGDR